MKESVKTIKDVEENIDKFIHELKMSVGTLTGGNPHEKLKCYLGFLKTPKDCPTGSIHIPTFVKDANEKYMRYLGERQALCRKAYETDSSIAYSTASNVATFDETSINELNHLFDTINEGDDNFFIFTFKEFRSQYGIVSYINPTFLVVDVVEENPYYDVSWDGSFESSPSPYSIRIYQMSDVSDMYTVGREIRIPDKDHDYHDTRSDIEALFRGMTEDQGIDNLETYTIRRVAPDVADYAVQLFNTISPKRIRMCRDCAHHFIMSDNEISWYDMKEYHLPGKCPNCRRKAKQARIEKEVRELYHDEL